MAADSIAKQFLLTVEMEGLCDYSYLGMLRLSGAMHAQQGRQ